MDFIKYSDQLVRKYVDSRSPWDIMLGSICAALKRDLTQEALDGKKNTGLSKNKITHLDLFKDITQEALDGKKNTGSSKNKITHLDLFKDITSYHPTK